MAQKVQVLLIDDLDGGEADETVTFALDGKAYEIDLNEANAQRFRNMLEPFRSKARRAGTGNLQARGVHFAPSKAVLRSDDSPKIRTWARRHQLPVNERGRVPSEIEAAYRAFQKSDDGPLRRLLEQRGLNPDKVQDDASRAAREEAEQQAASAPTAPSSDEVNRRRAKNAGPLSAAQLERLRRMATADDGRATSTGKSGDATSFEALTSRGLANMVGENIYEITTVGRLWFDAHGISPTPAVSSKS